jgi:hypothetical protein
MKYYFKVKYGYKPCDFVSVEAGPELEKALYAKIEKVPVTLGGKFIDGKNIWLIEKHVNKYTGWYESYDPTTGEDEAQIRRDVPKEIEDILQAHAEFVNGAIKSNNIKLIGSGKALSIALPEKSEVSRLTDGLANKMKLS